MTGNLLLNPLDFLSSVQRIQVHLGASAFNKREGLINGKLVHPLSSQREGLINGKLVHPLSFKREGLINGKLVHPLSFQNEQSF